MTSSTLSGALSPDLAAFGWRPVFSAELDIDELTTAHPARVTGVHRTGLDVAAPGFEARVPPLAGDPDDPEAPATVGDWVLLDETGARVQRRLPRQSLFKRRAAGTGRDTQLIAANVDTAFVVTSCNADFNIARLERYLALARQADVMPVILLTKADLAEETESFEEAARALGADIGVEAVNATDPAVGKTLAPWLAAGQTVAFLGSSGVGKSTLVNALLARDATATAGIREDDAKGRHTTTARALYRTPGDVWVLDTPGMRELQLTDVEEGLSAVYDEIETLAGQCRFRDCSHDGEPGCAVAEAIERGEVDPERLKRWRKLVAENRRNSESLHDRRARDKSFGKMVRRIMQDKRDR